MRVGRMRMRIVRVRLIRILIVMMSRVSLLGGVVERAGIASVCAFSSAAFRCIVRSFIRLLWRCVNEEDASAQSSLQQHQLPPFQKAAPSRRAFRHLSSW